MRVRLFWRILGALLLVSLIPLAVMGYSLHQRIQADFEARAHQEMRLLVDSAAANITAYVGEHLKVLKSTAATPAIAGMNHAEQEPVLTAVQSANPDFTSVITLGPDGRDVAQSQPGPSGDYSYHLHFKQVMAGANQAYQVLSSTTGKPSLSIAVPIRRGAGVAGALLATLDLDQVSSFVSRIKVGETGHAWLVDAEYKLMAHPDAEQVRARASMAGHVAVRKAWAGSGTAFIFEQDRRRWLGVQRILPQGWVLVVQMDEAEALAGVRQFNDLFRMVTAAALTVVALLAWVVSRSLSKPIKNMAAFVDRLAQGDFTASLALKRADELGDMAAALQDMRNGLRAHVMTLQRAAGRVAATAGDLGVAAAVAAESREVVSEAFTRTMAEVETVTGQQRFRLSTTRAAVVELVSAVEQVADSANHQAAEVTQASGAVHHVAGQIEAVTTGIKRVAGAHDRVISAAMAGQATVEGALAGMQVTSASVAEAGESIRQLGACAGVMVKFLQEISSMAAQTNLLAMNAAMGAQNQGDHGPGLAGEVRKLADRSVRLANDSSEMLTAVQGGVQQAISVMAKGEAAVRTGVDQAREARRALNEILEAVQSATRDVQSIGAAAATLLEGQKLLVRTFDTLAAVAEENSALAAEMAAGSETVRTSVHDLDTLALQNFAAIQGVGAELQSISRAVERVLESVQRLQTIKGTLAESVEILQV